MPQPLTGLPAPLYKSDTNISTFQSPTTKKVEQARERSLGLSSSSLVHSLDGLKITSSSEEKASISSQNSSSNAQVSSGVYKPNSTEQTSSKSVQNFAPMPKNILKEIFKEELQSQIDYYKIELSDLHSRKVKLEKYLQVLDEEQRITFACMASMKHNFKCNVIEEAFQFKITERVFLIKYILQERKIQEHEIKDLKSSDLFELAFDCYLQSDNYQIDFLNVCKNLYPKVSLKIIEIKDIQEKIDIFSKNFLELHGLLSES